MEFVMGSGGLAPGHYAAEFLGAEEWHENADKYGVGVALKFRVTSGAEAGAEASRIVSAKMTPKSALGKFAVAMKGAAIASGERFSFADYVGVTGAILVEPTDNGGGRITTFIKNS